MNRQSKLSQDIGVILLSSNLGEIDADTASHLISGLIEAAALHAVTEALKKERASKELRPRVRLAVCS